MFEATILFAQPFAQHHFTTMNPYETPDFKLTRNMLTVVGLMPDQSFPRQYFLFGIGLFGICSLCIPQILYCFGMNPLDRLLIAIPSLMSTFICTSKWVGCAFYTKRVKLLLEDYEYNWKLLGNTSDANILQRYAEEHKKMAYGYTIVMMGAVALYVLSPLVLGQRNTISLDTESQIYNYILYPANYLCDEREHYYLILFHESICLYITVIGGMSVDLLYVTLVRHVCGMFIVLRTRLENYPIDTDDRGDLYFKHTKRCIQLHIKILKSVDKIEQTFTGISLIDIALGILLQAGSLTIAAFTKDPSEKFRCSGVALAQLCRLYYNSWAGQDLMNHSAGVSGAIYSGRWYKRSAESKSLLIVFIQRSQVPCTLTIGGFFEYNYQSFLKVVKTSLSYCTILASVKSQDN